MYYCYHLWLVPIIYFDKLVRVPMFWFFNQNVGLNDVKNETKIGGKTRPEAARRLRRFPIGIPPPDEFFFISMFSSENQKLIPQNVPKLP